MTLCYPSVAAVASAAGSFDIQQTTMTPTAASVLAMAVATVAV
jgi:hypothetical protein